MSLTWIILGSFGEAMLGYFLFMVVAFSAGGIGNRRRLTRWQSRILDLALYALPGSCLLAAAIVIACYVGDSGDSAYAWYALPIVLAAAYVGYALKLNAQVSKQ